MLVKPLVRPIVRAIAGNPTASLGSGFSPTSLFLDGSKGVVYDNNDLSSFYLDSAGTTAATVNGLVGLQLDKSANLVLGAESAVNGSFDTDTNWTKGTGITISGGTLNFTSGTTLNANANQVIGATNGKYVEVTIVVSAITAGILNVQLDSGVGASNSITTAGTYTYRLFQLPGFNTVYILAKAAGTTATVDSISVKAIAGNHRYQTTTGSKPVLRGTPIGANLVTNGDFASGTGWTTGSFWAISGGTATKSAGGVGTLTSTFSDNVAGKVYRVEIDITSITPGTGNLTVRLTGGTSVIGASYTTAGRKVEYIVGNGTNNAIAIVCNASDTLAVVESIDVRDVSAGQVTAPYGLQYDGVDDFMQTASVDFTATDKMFVCAGVRKLSDAATAMLAELSVNVNTNNGSFYFAAPISAASDSYTFASKGTVIGGAQGSGYAAPVTSVVTGVSNIVGDSTIIRVNGVQAAVTGTDQGTGNYGNYALYFGRRGGTSLPYNGLDFGMVICGKTLTSTQISQTERYIAQRTGVTI